MIEEIKKRYAKFNIDVEDVLNRLSSIKISLHCWQLDDICGFEKGNVLSGGIQTTGNFIGKARDFDELKQDLDFAFKFIPGAKKLNLHSIYAITNSDKDRSELDIEDFKPWVAYAKERGLGLDFNPTLFSSNYMKDGLTLSSPDENIQNYWIKHCIQSRKISEYFGKELEQKSLCNLWIPDGFKDIPGDRMGPRERLKKALDEIYAYPCNSKYMDDSIESKVFGIGLESYTVGSHEFYLSYAMKNNICYLLDTGHFHPTENVADKISSILIFSPKIALHVSRPVRWDSDHVLRLNDELQEVADELVKCDALDKAYIGLDYFDASINRIAALCIGARNMQKALLRALLTPWKKYKELQNQGNFTALMVLQEEVKNLPFLEIWEEYCKKEGVIADAVWYEEVLKYENEVLRKRGN